MAAEPIMLEMEPMPAGCTCPVCGQALSYESPGRYECDICESAYAQAKTIEEVRADVEDLARGMTAMLGGTMPTAHFRMRDGSTAIVHMDPPEDAPPHFEWPDVDEEQRRWQDENAPSRRDHFVAELERLIRLASNRPFRGHVKARRALQQVARQHALTARAKAGKGPRKRSDRGLW